MKEERKKILDMLVQGKISTEEADGLLSALEGGKAKGETTSIPRGPVINPKFLRIVVENGPDAERVNVCVPFQLLRAGVRLAALIPKGLQKPINAALKEHGIEFDINAIKAEDLEDLVNHLAELTVDVDNPNERVKVFCE